MAQHNNFVVGGGIRPRVTAPRSRRPATSSARPEARTAAAASRLEPTCRASASPHRRPANLRCRCGAGTPPGTRPMPRHRCRSRFAMTPNRPQLAFEPPSTADPTMVTVAVTDKVSGLASGSIEISPSRLRDLAFPRRRRRTAAAWSRGLTMQRCQPAPTCCERGRSTRQTTKRQPTDGSTASR